jgi:uncharacterized membrane protein YoaK (UPF0700 family)
MPQRLEANRLAGLKPKRTGVWFIAALAWIAGTVNALGYLVIGDVFTSHMTGDTSAVVIALITGRGSQIAHRLVAVAAFVFGVTAAAVLIERHREHSAAGALWLEAGLLCTAGVLAMLGGGTTVITYCSLIALAAAMGVQNTALTGSALGAHTTHITGPLTDFASTAVRRIVGRRDLPRDRSHGLLVYGGRVLAFVVGVATGALLSFFGPGALLIPSFATAIGAAALQRTPQ